MGICGVHAPKTTRSERQLRSVIKVLSILSLVAIIGIVALQVLAATSKSSEKSGLNRLPASISLGFTVTEKEEAKISEIQIVKLDCLENLSTVEVPLDVALIRVTGQWCETGKMVKVKTSTSLMQNRATGLYATVFNMPQQRFSSDLIALANGNNSVSITVQDDTGHAHLYQLEINRK